MLLRLPLFGILLLTTVSCSANQDQYKKGYRTALKEAPFNVYAHRRGLLDVFPSATQTESYLKGYSDAITDLDEVMRKYKKDIRKKYRTHLYQSTNEPNISIDDFLKGNEEDKTELNKFINEKDQFFDVHLMKY